MALWQLWLIARGESTVESHDNDYYRKLAKHRSKIFRNPYDLGWMENIRYFFNVGEGRSTFLKNPVCHISGAQLASTSPHTSSSNRYFAASKLSHSREDTKEVDELESDSEDDATQESCPQVDSGYIEANPSISEDWRNVSAASSTRSGGLTETLMGSKNEHNKPAYPLKSALHNGTANTSSALTCTAVEKSKEKSIASTTFERSDASTSRTITPDHNNATILHSEQSSVFRFTRASSPAVIHSRDSNRHPPSRSLSAAAETSYKLDGKRRTPESDDEDGEVVPQKKQKKDRDDEDFTIKVMGVLRSAGLHIGFLKRLCDAAATPDPRLDGSGNQNVVTYDDVRSDKDTVDLYKASSVSRSRRHIRYHEQVRLSAEAGRN
ncbi:hypothetical protein EMMF5_003615 [Cystobasidiomycetes sp. EMM_F5]